MVMNYTGFDVTCTSHLSFGIRRSAKITDKMQKILFVVVLPTRFERARISPRDFKSLVSANFHHGSRLTAVSHTHSHSGKLFAVWL